MLCLLNINLFIHSSFLDPGVFISWANIAHSFLALSVWLFLLDRLMNFLFRNPNLSYIAFLYYLLFFVSLFFPYLSRRGYANYSLSFIGYFVIDFLKKMCRFIDYGTEQKILSSICVFFTCSYLWFFLFTSIEFNCMMFHLHLHLCLNSFAKRIYPSYPASRHLDHQFRSCGSPMPSVHSLE